MLIDTHAHLYWESFKEDFDQVLNRAKDAGVTTIVNVGVDPHLSAEAARLEADQVKFYSTIGIHPHEAAKYATENPDESINTDIEIIKKIAEEYPRKVVAVGECGLDYFFENSPEFVPEHLTHAQLKNLQKKLFQSQIDLAKELDLPLVIHVRDDRSKDLENMEAWNDALEMIGNHPTILHCYSGLLPTTERALQKENILFSFAATLTYPRNEYLRAAVKLIPLEKIVLETDCPFLPPQSKRGVRNEPTTIKELAKFIAELKEIPFEEVADQTIKNAFKILKIS